jgi:hypothetical protein
MSATNADKVRDYFNRQYELEEGSVEENISALFAENPIIRLEDGNSVTLEDIARAATRLRQVPRSERTFELSDLKEEGDTVAFHSLVRFRDPETGEMNELESDAVWRFNGQGKVVESRSNASIVSAMPSGDS